MGFSEGHWVEIDKLISSSVRDPNSSPGADRSGSQTASTSSLVKIKKGTKTKSRHKSKTSGTARDDSAGQASGGIALVSQNVLGFQNPGEAKNPADLKDGHCSQ